MTLVSHDYDFNLKPYYPGIVHPVPFMSPINVLNVINSTRTSTGLARNCFKRCSPVSPRHALLSTSVTLGRFEASLRHASPPRRNLAGAFSSPIALPCRRLSKKAGKSKNNTSSRQPQPSRWTKSKAVERPAPKEEDSSSWNSRQQALRPIPLPSPVKGYPTPILNHDDVSFYLRQLYRRGWSIEYRRKKDSLGKRYPVTSLQVYFDNLSWDAFFTLGKFVTQLGESEKHHGEWKLRDYGTALDFRALRLLGFEFPDIVAFLIRTHNAVLSEPVELSDWQATGVIEGLTLRDVRFAILLDELIAKHNAETTDPQLRITKRLEEEGSTPKTLERLLMEPDDDKPKLHKRKRGKPVLRVEEFYIEDPGFGELEKLGLPMFGR